MDGKFCNYMQDTSSFIGIQSTTESEKVRLHRTSQENMSHEEWWV